MQLSEINPSARPGFIQRLIAGCANNPFLTILTVAAIVAWGYYSLRQVPLDAIPDLSDAQVIVFTEWPGRSPDLVEDQITYPISTALLAAPKVKFVRGQSFLGLSFVYVIFEDGTDIYWGRSRVLEYLNSVTGKLPDGVNPTLGPDATGVGWVFQYALVDKSGNHDLSQLRSFQDWYVRYALEGVEGVAEVASVGGFVKQYQIQLDPDQVLAYNIPIQTIIQKVRRSNTDVGGRVLEQAGHEYMIRGRGYIKSKADIESIPVGIGKDGVPIQIKDLGKVTIGPDMRRGLAELNGEGEAVGGIVIMRYGENALTTIENVKKRLVDVRKSLPEGVELVVVYDRSELIGRAIATLRHTLIEEMIVVSIIITIFLLHFRSALIPIVALPIAVILAFIPMSYQHLTANIMSLGGIAVAIGAMVDASIIIIENIHKKLETWEEAGRPAEKTRRGVIVEAMQEVGPSIFFSLLVITVAFLPVFTLEATEGRLFRPLAYTKTYSMGFAAILAVTLVPALAALIIRGKIRGEKWNPINRMLVAGYAPVVRFVVRHRWLVVACSVAAMIATIPAFFRLGNEFMPPLNEGSILYMPTAPPGMSITEASTILQSQDRKLREVPEVQSVFGKIGRSRTATDPAPLSMVETVIVLKPESEWREGMTWDKLIKEMDQKLAYPGMPNIWWMPIQTRTEMLATGIRSALGIKVFGSSLEEIEATAVQVEKALQDDPRVKPYTRSVFAERVTGGYFLDFNVKREEAARYGMTVGDVEDLVQTAIGGMNIDQTIEGRERYPIQVRYARQFRDKLDMIKKVLVPTPTGTQVPISHVADIDIKTGAPMIRSEDGRLVGFVFVDVTDIGIADYVQLARQAVDERVTLPASVRLAWAGQFQYFERAKEKLKIVVPLTLLIVCFLLYSNTKSVIETLIVLLAVPFSLIGAIWLLYLLNYNMSVAVWVGLIALAGLDAETGVIMLLYLNLSHKRWIGEGRLQSFRDLEDAIVDGAANRIRPKLMTVLTTFIGLFPLMLSTGTGADVMKRIAAPMVGGLATSFLLELTVYPAIFALWKCRKGLTK
ncbi:MAG: CusA/CzcA family heavy metal efflux RND transporter [Planctomycetes bacterium]|nr:CusA/CzcA family heavy metal efflux RND transporter [Planctomycetota bacterium]